MPLASLPSPSQVMAFILIVIDDASEVRFSTDRICSGTGARAKLILDVGEAHVEVGAALIHFIGEDDARDVVLVALAPDGFGLRLDALVRVENADSPVKHAQRTLDFDREVDVAWRVDDVQAAHFNPSRPGQKQVVAADVIVMPRSAS